MTDMASAGFDRGGLPLDRLQEYLDRSGWRLTDRDSSTTLWVPTEPDTYGLQVVLPVSEHVLDYDDRVLDALRVIAVVERRSTTEILDDVAVGGADIVSVRLTPDLPPGQAPLITAHSAIGALRDLIIGSAAALTVDSPVLPARRPQRAEAYANQARVQAKAGSFVLSVTLPLREPDPVDDEPTGQTGLFAAAEPEPYGRRVTSRMLRAVQQAKLLAEQVGTGDLPLRAFAESPTGSVNATELSALSAIGGPEHDRYSIRFAQSALVPTDVLPTLLTITPANQRILLDAAEFLRTRQPRSGVNVAGLVVRLFREGATGPGEVVVQGADDDTGIERRFRVSLSESDYDSAVRAHREGLQVLASGDVTVRGTKRHLRPLTSFAVLPGLEED